jgi:chemotaxis signal transduction protein
MQKNSITKSSEKRVLIFPAQTPKIANRQIYFLFSLRQMEDILTEATVRPVPFSPAYIEGAAEWRGNVLPVISMEACLGLELLNSQKIQRLMVVRAAQNGYGQNDADRMMLRVIPPIHMLTLPIECSPVSGERIFENYLAKGVYEWKNNFLVAVDVENILDGGN